MASNPTTGQTDKTSRLHLFNTTFWQELPAHYDRICTRWTKIANMHHEASSALLPTDRAAGVDSLKAEITMLEHDINEYKQVVRGIDAEDVVCIHMTAGRQRWRAKQIAKEDFQNLEESWKVIESKVGDVKADLVYGFMEEPEA